jgi:hypothetical protein|tara:strand:+ start:808 stop:1080 length:273 start_codon:yes stop_codon:yes gene_type:complete
MERLKKWSASGISAYLTENYGESRHDCRSLKRACEIVAKNHHVDPTDLFHFLIENEPVQGLYLHSYGFHTRTGRGIIREISYTYDELNDE